MWSFLPGVAAICYVLLSDSAQCRRQRRQQAQKYLATAYHTRHARLHGKNPRVNHEDFDRSLAQQDRFESRDFPGADLVFHSFLPAAIANGERVLLEFQHLHRLQGNFLSTRNRLPALQYY
jgi:hypothetical protein